MTIACRVVNNRWVTPNKKMFAVLLFIASQLSAQAESPVPLALTISGGVSLGSYEAGYLWAVLAMAVRLASRLPRRVPRWAWKSELSESTERPCQLFARSGASGAGAVILGTDSVFASHGIFCKASGRITGSMGHFVWGWSTALTFVL